MSEPLAISRRGVILEVRIDRPEKRNALSAATLDALQAAFTAHASDETLTVALLTGTGDRAFAAGGDLHDLQSLRTAPEIERFILAARGALDAVRRFPVPVVAALNGDALGGGAELALACDIRLAAASARIGFLQGRLAISTAWGGGVDLMRLLGSARALELLASSRMVTAAEAAQLGLVQAVAPAEENFIDFVARWLDTWAHQRPQVMRAFKAQALAERFGATRAEREFAEFSGFVASWLHDDHWQAAERTIAGLRR